MAPVSDYSTTPADNTSISGLTVTDSTVADTLDNIIRQLMADVKAADDANAKTAANETITGNWTFAGTTIADIGTVTTADINGGTLDGVTIGGSTPAAATVTDLTATGNILAAKDNPTLSFDDTTGSTATHRRTYLTHTNNAFSINTANSTGTFVATDILLTKGASGTTLAQIFINGSERLRVNSAETYSPLFQTNNITIAANILPSSGTPDIGSSISRFGTIYLTSSPNVSSDARLKDNIADLTDAERRAAAKIKARTYTLKATGKKKVGYIAQEIIEAMASEGLDALEYGLVTLGNEEGGDLYGVDYDAINAFRLG